MIKKNMLKKLLASILLASFLFTLGLSNGFFVPRTQAQGTWYNQSPVEFYSKVYDESNPSEIFGERYTVAQVDWIVWSVITWLPTKISPKLTLCGLEIIFSGGVADCITTLLSSVEPEENKYALESNESLVEAVFSERPLSGITYFTNIARKLSITPEARAQAGFGFKTALDPILPMWRASRDIAYAIFVLVAVVLAFMIMFRVKISPQVIITVQSALPKLFIAIILVTFSYAIAGLLVDLMYVAIGIVSLFGASFLPDAPLINETTAVFNFLTKGQPFNINVNLGVMGLIVLYLNIFMYAFVFIIAVTLGAAGTAVSGVVAGIGLVALGLSGGLIIVGIIALVILFILSVVIILMAIKTVWMLVKAYASILLLTIFAPFQFTLGVLIPGIVFSACLKSFVANLSFFLTTGLLFFLSFVFIIQAVGLALNNLASNNLIDRTIVDIFLNVFFGTLAVDLFSANYSADWPPLLGVATDSAVPFLFLVVSLVIFFIIPKTADIIKAAIEGKPFAYGTAIGEAVGPVGMAGRTYSDYAAGQISEGQPVKPFGKYMNPENWSQGVKTAVEGIFGAFGRRRR